MKYLTAGILTGVLLSLFTLRPEAGIRFNAEWTGSISSPETIETPPFPGEIDLIFPVIHSGGFYHLDGSGRLVSRTPVKDKLFSVSSSGLYYAGYQQTGSGVEFFNSDKNRFWRIDSSDYPYVSSNGELILLLNGDQTAVSVYDIDAREVPGSTRRGRLCTVISFSERGDNAAVGFLDGYFYVVNDRGRVVFSGSTAPDKPVKSGAVSSNGLYAAFHYGDDSGDFLLLIDIERDTMKSVPLENRYYMRSALHVSENGKTVFLGRDRVSAFSIRGASVFHIEMPPGREGHASISRAGDYYAAAYTESSGAARLIFFSRRGIPLFTESFPRDTYGDVRLEEGLIFFRGSDHLYCYSHRF